MPEHSRRGKLWKRCKNREFAGRKCATEEKIEQKWLCKDLGRTWLLEKGKRNVKERNSKTAEEFMIVIMIKLLPIIHQNIFHRQVWCPLNTCSWTVKMHFFLLEYPTLSAPKATSIHGWQLDVTRTWQWSLNVLLDLINKMWTFLYRQFSFRYGKVFFCQK